MRFGFLRLCYYLFLSRSLLDVNCRGWSRGDSGEEHEHQSDAVLESVMVFRLAAGTVAEVGGTTLRGAVRGADPHASTVFFRNVCQRWAVRQQRRRSKGQDRSRQARLFSSLRRVWGRVFCFEWISG